MTALDISGRKYNFLTAIKRAPNQGRVVRWLCRCECGNEKIVNAGSLKNGGTKSCGCLAKASSNLRKHGLYRTPSYSAWLLMVRRLVTNPTAVCDRWKIATNFFEDMGTMPEDCTILLRPDPFKPFQPGNCQWSPKVKQPRIPRVMPVKPQPKPKLKPKLESIEVDMKKRKSKPHKPMGKPVGQPPTRPENNILPSTLYDTLEERDTVLSYREDRYDE